MFLSSSRLASKASAVALGVLLLNLTVSLARFLLHGTVTPRLCSTSDSALSLASCFSLRNLHTSSCTGNNLLITPSNHVVGASTKVSSIPNVAAHILSWSLFFGRLALSAPELANPAICELTRYPFPSWNSSSSNNSECAFCSNSLFLVRPFQ